MLDREKKKNPKVQVSATPGSHFFADRVVLTYWLSESGTIIWVPFIIGFSNQLGPWSARELCRNIKTKFHKNTTLKAPSLGLAKALLVPIGANMRPMNYKFLSN